MQAREATPCVALELGDRAQIELSGVSPADRYPNTGDWPRQILDAVRSSYCQGAPLHGQPAPIMITRIAANLRGTATVELRVDAGDGKWWPVELELERDEQDGRWSLPMRWVARPLARMRLMGLARWLEHRPEVDILSSSELDDGWWLTRGRDANGSTICLLQPERGAVHCYRDARAIEHVGSGPIAYPPETEEPADQDLEQQAEDGTLPARKLGFTLLLWPLPDPHGRTTEPWLFDTGSRRACRAKPLRWPDQAPNAIYQWRSTSTAMATPQRAPKVDARDCEPLAEVAAPEWVQWVHGIRAFVVSDRDGPRAVSLELTTGDIVGSVESVLCIREGERRCGVLVHPNDEDRYHHAAVVGTIERVVDRYDEKTQQRVKVRSRRIHALVLDYWMAGAGADLSYVDTSHVQFLELVDGRWEEAIEPLLIGARERVRSPDRGGVFWMKRFYAAPLLRSGEHIELELVVADSLRFRGGKLESRTLDRHSKKRRCVGRSNGSWTDVELEQCRAAPREAAAMRP